MKKTSFLLLLTCLLSEFAFAQSTYLVVMSKGHLAKNQTYFISATFPEAKIETRKSEGFYVDDLSYGQKGWAISMSDREDVLDQVYAVDSTYPEDFVQAFVGQGFSMTSIAFGEEGWAVVMSKLSKSPEQKILADSTFDTEYVFTQAREGYLLADIAWGYPNCRMIFNKGGNITGQRLVKSNQFPGDKIKELLEGAAYRITHLSYQNNQWIAVFSKGTPYTSQDWYVKSVSPQNFIQQGWDEGYIATQFQQFVVGNEEVGPPLLLTAKSPDGAAKDSSLSEKDLRCPKVSKNTPVAKIAAGIFDLKKDDDRLKAAQTQTSALKACLKVKHVEFIAQTMEEEENIFDWLKYAYPMTYNQEEYTQLESLLKTEKYQKKFRQLIK